MKLLGNTTALLVCGALATTYATVVNAQTAAQPFDQTLLTPERLPMNQPLDVEPYADPEVLNYLAPVRATFDNLAITESAPTNNPRTAD